MITEKDLEKLIADLMPAPDPIVLHSGKGFVRELAKARFGESYTFRQLLSLFREGFVTGHGGVYEIRSSPRFLD